MTMHTLTALFTSRDRAIAAASELRHRGLSSHVTLSPKVAHVLDAVPERTSFWAWLDALLGDSPDRLAYLDAVGRGETVLTAVVVETGASETLCVLDHHLAVRTDRRCLSWRDEQPSANDPEDWTLSKAQAPDVPGESTAPVAMPSNRRNGGREVPCEPVEPRARQTDHSSPGVARGESGLGETLMRPRSSAQASLTRMAEDLWKCGSVDMPKLDGDFPSRGQSRTWKVRVGMCVVGSDGVQVGIVEAIGREAVVLAADGLTRARHRLPEDWVAVVETKVVLKLAGADAVRRWTDAD